MGRRQGADIGHSMGETKRWAACSMPNTGCRARSARNVQSGQWATARRSPPSSEGAVDEDPLRQMKAPWDPSGSAAARAAKTLASSSCRTSAYATVSATARTPSQLLPERPDIPDSPRRSWHRQRLSHRVDRPLSGHLDNLSTWASSLNTGDVQQGNGRRKAPPGPQMSRRVVEPSLEQRRAAQAAQCLGGGQYG